MRLLLRLIVCASIVSGCEVGSVNCASGATKEERDFSAALKTLDSGDAMLGKAIALRWIDSPGAKLRARWLDFFVQYNLSYGHAPDVPKIFQAVKLEPHSARIRTTYALALLVERKGEQALAAALEATRLDPKDKRAQSVYQITQYCYGRRSPPNRTDVIALAEKGGTVHDIYVAAAHFFMLRFDKNGERSVWDALVRNNPDNAYGYTRRGIFERRSGSYQNGERDLRKAIAISPRNIEACRNLSEILFKSKQWEECIKSYKYAATLGMNYGEAMADRGSCNVALKNYDEAIADFTGALEFHQVKGTRLQQMKAAKANSGIYQHYIYQWLWKRADCYRALGKYEQALDDLKFAGFLFPADISVIEVKARVHKDQGRYDLALNEASQVVKERPHLARSFRERADIFKKLGRKADSDRDTLAAEQIEANSGQLKFKNIYVP